ncbi:MAG: sialidase family protein [Terriglobales bacterium]
MIPKITTLRLPVGEIQPQSAIDRQGVQHMIYFEGDPSAGNIEYVQRKPGAQDFSTPIRVNSQPRSALAVGTVRGPQLALGPDGSVYVVWMGSKQAEPLGPGGTTPLLFSRLSDSRTAFEPQRNLIQYATGLNGGLSVAADLENNVYVMWHATGAKPGEANRRVYLARSTDGGKSFARERAVSPAPLGACGCCGMRGFVDSHGTLYILYRAAGENIHRDMTLLVSSDRGRSFRASTVAPWELDACPMSADYLSEGGQRVLAAWETAGQVYFDEIDPGTFALSSAFSASGEADDRKHPAIAANSRGQVLLSWTEGTAWSKGGSLAWQLYDLAGRPIGTAGHASGVPVWGLPTILPDRNGNFTIIY